MLVLVGQDLQQAEGVDLVLGHVARLGVVNDGEHALAVDAPPPPQPPLVAALPVVDRELHVPTPVVLLPGVIAQPTLDQAAAAACMLTSTDRPNRCRPATGLGHVRRSDSREGCGRGTRWTLVGCRSRGPTLDVTSTDAEGPLRWQAGDVTGLVAGSVPEGYGELLDRLKGRVRAAQVRAARSANVEVLRLYWSVGHDIVERQGQDGWGSRVIDRLAADLRAEFPAQRGWSRRNLHYMRSLALAWPEESAFVPHAVAQLPWGHVRLLLDRLDSAAERDWYAASAAAHGWSREVLRHQVDSGLMQRSGAAPSNFAAVLPPADSELAQQLVRDPYVFDQLGLTERVAERDLEQALMDRLEKTLLEFGHGMAFVGRQVRFEVAGDELVVDLLLFHVEQLRYVVVELKIGRFEPGYVGQLGTYVALVDDRLRRPDRHAATVGILLCRGRNEAVVRYALGGAPAPLAVADYTYEALPAAERAALPTADDLAAALQLPLHEG